MRRLKQPSLAINDYRVLSRYAMVWTISASKSDKRRSIINQVAALAKITKLKNVVIHCHGNSGALHLGKSWFKRKHTHYFRAWRNRVEKIWIKSCEVALIEEAGTHNDGNLFVSEIAKAAKCYVIASTEIQRSLPRTYPFGCIDAFEGLVLKYGPKGNVTWSKRYGGWLSNLE